MYRTEIILDKFDFGQKPAGMVNNSNTYNNQAQDENNPPTSSSPASDEINYPEEDINPEDIPF